jgi:hypothetical protein
MYTTTRRRIRVRFFILAGVWLCAAIPMLSQAQAEVPAQTQVPVPTQAPPANDAERAAQCDRDLCAIIRVPSTEGRPLRCDLGITLYKEQIDKAARSKRLIWPFGDARCTLSLDVRRALLARTMTQDHYTLKLPKQPAHCDVDYRGTRYPMTVQLAPEIEFRDGRATSVKFGVQEIQGNMLVRALIWSTARLEDNFGLLQGDVVAGVNQYIERHCRARPAGRRQVRLDELTAR